MSKLFGQLLICYWYKKQTKFGNENINIINLCPVSSHKNVAPTQLVPRTQYKGDKKFVFLVTGQIRPPQFWHGSTDNVHRQKKWMRMKKATPFFILSYKQLFCLSFNTKNTIMNQLFCHNTRNRSASMQFLLQIGESAVRISRFTNELFCQC